MQYENDLIQNPKTLADELAACPVNFDPNHDHEHGGAQPPKVAFVPVELFERVRAALLRASGAGE